MNKPILLLLAISALLFPSTVPRPAQAITIEFEAIDLAAPGPNGGDLWQYLYFVSDFTPQENVAFEVLFNPILYSDLEDPPPTVPDWGILIFQPDPNIPDPGRYSALALLNGAVLSGPFSLSFVWLGATGTTPGVQPFEVNEFDAQGNFLQTLDTGQTIPHGVIPEPGTFLLVGTGLVGLGLMRKRVRENSLSPRGRGLG